MDAAMKYGNLRMIIEIFEIIDDFNLKPNAAIMQTMLLGLSKNNHTM